jgi:hypothetical protein
MLHPHPHRHRTRSFAACCKTLALLTVLAWACGCNIMGAVAAKVTPPPVVKAYYTPKQEPLIVVVERRENPAEAWMDSERIARLITGRLKAKQVAPTIDPSVLPDMSGVGRPGRPGRFGDATLLSTEPVRRLPAAEAGRMAGAKQVLYVDLVEFDAQPVPGSEISRGKVTAEVQMIDAATGATLWPTDTSQGHRVSVSTPPTQVSGATGEQAVRDQLCEELAVKVSRLFHKWVNEDALDSGSPMDD